MPPDIKLMNKRMGIDFTPETVAQGANQPMRLVEEIVASLDMSEGYFKRELPRRPSDPELWGNYGVFLQHHGRAERAEEAFRKAASLDPSTSRRHALAVFLGASSATMPEAISLYSDMMEKEDVSSDLRSDFARLLDLSGDLDRAEIEHSSAAAVGDSAKARCRYEWFIWRWRARADEAGKIFEEIVNDVSSDTECLLLMAHLLFRARGDLKTAENFFLAALSSDPKNLWGLRNYGDLLLIRGDA